MTRHMWTIAGFALRTPAISYATFAIVLLCKWTVWFPAMLVQYGLRGALDAALTDPAGRLPSAPRLTGIAAQVQPNWKLTH